MPVANINGTVVSYKESGKGEPVVMLHASASCGSQWQGLRDQLSGDFRCIAPDLYGCGKTDPWPGRDTMSLAAEAALINGLVSRFEGRFHLVGHSYGGAVALRLAARCDHKLRSLTLIEPVSFNLLRSGTEADQILFEEICELAEVLCRSAISGDEWNAMGRFVDYWSGKGTWAGMSWQQRKCLAPRVRSTVRHFWATMREPMTKEDYVSMRTPTAVISGGLSRRTTRRICDILAETLPEGHAVVLEDAAHMGAITHSDQVAAAMRPFLEEKIQRKSEVVKQNDEQPPLYFSGYRPTLAAMAS